MAATGDVSRLIYRFHNPSLAASGHGREPLLQRSIV
jgi:hypothetical protein